MRSNMDLSTKLAGITLRNPTMNASGVLIIFPPMMKAFEDHGIGAVVGKSVTKEPREGNNGPTVIQRSEDVCMNRMGLPNPGVEEYIEEIKKYEFNIPVIISVAGFSLEEYVSNAIKGVEVGKIIEVNLSCPNVEGGTICFAIDQTYKICREIVDNVDVPVFSKLSPYTNLLGLNKTIDAVYKSGVDGITLTNTAPSLSIISLDIAVNERRNNNLFKGGLSSKALFPISLRNVYEASKYIEKEGLELDLIGVGGIETHEEMISYILCGAKATQFGSAAALHFNENYKEIPRSLCNGLEDFMRDNNYKSLEDFRGEVYR
ncbi:MAG: hypothetical protein JSW73_00940 [Candidatus Woesearchaeota archaeon]|nr:MAG: hypothetical protein JSW73_00940 [Candidatus Woesearchaeota archaeon]